MEIYGYGVLGAPVCYISKDVMDEVGPNAKQIIPR